MSEPAHQVVLHVGCQRSGTTLLHLILDSHSQIQSFDENMIELFQRYLAAPTVPISTCPTVSFKLPEVANPWEPAQPFLFRAPGQPKYLFITRHVFDVAVSMCQLELVFRARHGPGRRVIKWLQKSACRYAMLKYGTSRLPRHLAHPLVFAATWWAEHNRFWLARAPEISCHHLKYEDLVTHPRETLEKVTEFLGCPWEEALLHHARLPHAPGTGTTLGRTDPRRPIDQRSVGRGHVYLTAEHRRLILGVCEDVLHVLGYSSEASPLGVPA